MYTHCTIINDIFIPKSVKMKSKVSEMQNKNLSFELKQKVTKTIKSWLVKSQWKLSLLTKMKAFKK